MSAQDIVNSEKFKKLVSRRWMVSFIMLIILFAVYYGYVFIIAYNKDFIASKVIPGGSTSMGIILSIGVILAAWILTLIYVLWANKKYDPAVEELKQELK